MRTNLNKLALAFLCAGVIASCGKKDDKEAAFVAAPTPQPVAPQDPNSAFQVQGAELLNNAQGKGQITFMYPGADSYTCALSQGSTPGKIEVCAGALAIDMPALKASLTAGPAKLTIHALKGQQILATRTFDFCIGDCGQGQAAATPALSRPGIVGGYNITLSQDYLVDLFTYTSDKTQSTVLAETPGRCKNPVMMSVGGSLPAPYCDSSTIPIKGMFEFKTGFTLTNASMVISSAPKLNSQYPSMERQIHIKQYSSKVKFNATNSRFQYFCGGLGRAGNVNTESRNINGEIESVLGNKPGSTNRQPMPIARDFNGNMQFANILSCTARGDDGQPWRVGVVILENFQAMNIQAATPSDWTNFCGTVADKTIVEIVFQERVSPNNSLYENFAVSMSDALAPMLRRNQTGVSPILSPQVSVPGNLVK